MSSQTRASGGGGGGGGRKKANSTAADTTVTTNNNITNNNNNKKTDHVKIVEKEKSKPTAEQMRIAQITEVSSEDPKMREKVASLMETTQRSEEEVCCALYECDNDLDRAVIFLLETLPVGAFETSSKKKKNRLTSGSNDAGGDGDWNENNTSGGGGGGGGGGGTGGGSGGTGNNNDVRERSRNRSGMRGMRGGRGGSDSRGWHGREARENERNTNDTRGGGGGAGDRGGDRGNDRGGDRSERWQGGGGGGGRGGGRGGYRGGYGGYGGRGGRGGRMGPRSTRDQNRSNFFAPDENHDAVDRWDNTIATAVVDTNKADDTWGDWDNEEYTGSLADTKVFTPSTMVQNQSVTSGGELSAPPGLEQQILNPPTQLTADDLVQQYSATVVSSTATAGAVAAVNNNSVQYQPDSQLRQTIDLPQINASLSVEQSQYFNSLSSQNSSQQQQVAAAMNAYQVPVSVQYPVAGGYGTSNYVEVGSQPPTTVRKQRARVPPPSKIPSTAVEMPGDTLNNIGYLDVEFGELDFGNDESFDQLSEKFNAASLDNSQNVSVVNDVVNEYQSKAVSVQQQQQQQQQQQNSALSASLQQQTSQMIPNADTLSNQNDSLTSAGAYNQRTSNSVQQQSNSVSINNNAALEQLSKADHYNNQTVVNSSVNSGVVSGGGSGGVGGVSGSSGYQHQSYTNNVVNSGNVGGGVVGKSAGGYQSSSTPQGFSNSNYTNAQQVTTGSSYPTSSNTYNSYNQPSVNSYQQQNNSVNSVVNNSSSTSGGGVGNSSTVGSGSSVGVGGVGNVSATSSGVVGGGSSAVPSIPVGSSNAVNNSNSNSGYLSSQYPSSQTTSSYPSQQPSNVYQNSQSVYGNTGLTNNTGYTNSTNTSTAQYSNFSSTKLSKETTPATTIYESVVSSSTPSAVANSSAITSTSSMSSPSLGLTNTKVTNSTAKSSGVVPNIPMVSQYIQTGMPFYQQPVYSFEEIQMMQQRMPHVPAGYYDLNYQTPTSLGAGGVREANLGSVAYSTMSDGRFTRTDNNSSPVSNVPSTMSQQTGSGGPMLNLPYAYFYGGNMMPGSFQYGTPAIYPQQMAATNASSGAQFPKPSYNSGYGSTGYDTLSQTGQEYNKGAYPGTGVGGQQSKGQNVTNPPPTGTGTDISSSMYGKSHVALNKVNSYEKQSFHSATPPPFNLPGTQNAGATSAQAYGTQHLYIQAMPAGHHNMNMHQPIHQMDGRIHNTSWRDSNSTGQRQQSSTQGKTGAKPGYSPSYWTAQN